MDMEFMDEYYERMRADEIDRFAGQRNDEYARDAFAKGAYMQGASDREKMVR